MKNHRLIGGANPITLETPLKRAAEAAMAFTAETWRASPNAFGVLNTVDMGAPPTSPFIVVHSDCGGHGAVTAFIVAAQPSAVMALLAERDAATARAEGAERERDAFKRNMEAAADLAARYGSERDAAIAERDALRDEWEEIAAGITTEQPEVGALWPMVSEINGNLAAARNLFRNEVVAHNRTKAERDRLRAALEKAAIAAEVESAGHAIAIIEDALTSAKEPSA